MSSSPPPVPARHRPARPAPPPPARRAPSWRRELRFALRTVCWVALATGLALGLYLTLRPSSSFKDLWWLPGPVERWADYYGRFRNVPAFALLAAPVMIIANGRRARRTAIFWLGAFVAVTELAQYFIPTRWCEWQDIACGWAGLLATWSLFEASFWVSWKIHCAGRRRRARSFPLLPATAPALQPVLVNPRRKPPPRE